MSLLEGIIDSRNNPLAAIEDIAADDSIHEVILSGGDPLTLVDANKTYPLPQAVEVLQKFPKAKFNETVEVAFHLGVDPKQSDQMVRGTVPLPHGSGKTVRVLVFAIMAVGWNVMSGFGGMFSFGHAAYFGLGAYTGVWLLVEHGVSPWLGMLAGEA